MSKPLDSIPKTKETSCDSCGEEIRVLVVERDPGFHCCGKSDCIIEVLTRNDMNPLQYGVSPKEIKEYYERRLK